VCAGIPSLVTASDFELGRRPDENSVMNYVSMLLSASQSTEMKNKEGVLSAVADLCDVVWWDVM